MTAMTKVRKMASLASLNMKSSIPNAHTMPPNIAATPVQLTTFVLPQRITGNSADVSLGKSMVKAWQKDGIFQIQMPPSTTVIRNAYQTSKEFFALNHEQKARCVDDQTFAGYIASGEELTDGIADYSEIFTVTKDLKAEDTRVQQKWPCHGSVPWPSKEYQNVMDNVMASFGEVGETLLHLTALGLGLHDPKALTDLTDDGWHHMRVLRFPAANNVNGKGKPGRGIGAHTDYGLLVIASQDDVGGLFTLPPKDGESIHNWNQSAAGWREEDDGWNYIPPAENILTVFPGDMMQYLTSDFLPSTPHKVGLNTRERFAFAYFHEPAFDRVVKPLEEYSREGIHYGSHFTNMFMRNYPERITAKRMHAEKRMDELKGIVRTGDLVYPKGESLRLRELSAS